MIILISRGVLLSDGIAVAERTLQQLSLFVHHLEVNAPGTDTDRINPPRFLRRQRIITCYTTLRIVLVKFSHGIQRQPLFTDITQASFLET
jgi:hypothetical protein